MQANEHISLAVFPFEDLSLQKDLGIFCRSFSADLVTELSRFRQFQVINLHTQAAGADISSTKMFDTLETDYFIQGTFRYEKDHVRINVQLYESRTRHLLWGNRLEGMLTEMNDIQDHLLTGIIGVLQQQINYDLLSKTKKRQKVEFRAYEQWLYGMEELKKASLESDQATREHFQKALQIQPDYSLAYLGMALTYFNEWSCQVWDRWDVSKSGAYEWAQKAIELDDQNYLAAMVLGKIYLYEGSFDTAEYYLRKSLLLNPNDSETLIQIAVHLVFLGSGNEAIKLYERTLRLNPANTGLYLSVGVVLFFELGEYEKAAQLVMQALKAKWANYEAYCAAIYYYLQQYDKMQTHWNSFLATYRRLIAKEKDFHQREAIDWLLKISPYKYKTNLEPFLQFISNGSFEKYSPPKNQPEKQNGKGNYFLKEMAIWKLSFEGSIVQVNEVKGLYDIQKMLMQPRQLYHCAELMGSTIYGKGEKLIDEKARNQYQKKILELQTDIQEAEQHSNFTRLEKLQEEYDRLIEHLSQSLGLKGKAREAGSTVEKARSAVTWRVRNAIARIEQFHPMLGAHLSNAIKTGILCSYQPDRDLFWITS